MSVFREIKSFMKTLLISLVVVAACVAGLYFYGVYQRNKPLPPTREEIMAQIIVESTLSEQEAQEIIDANLVHISIEPGIPENHVIPMNVILQNPELPAGCEVTSLAMLLNYLGLAVDKCDLSDNYLPKGDVGTVDMNTAFIGDPRKAGSYGCFAPVIVDTAAGYIADNRSSLKVYNLTGSNFTSLFQLIADDKPVIVWTTINLLPTTVTTTWQINENTVFWQSQEHCVVLCGYDYGKSTVTIADPLAGITEYDMGLFITRYNELFKQAVCIY
ncbi:MAG: C39 family peptidase [Alistipes sp.]|nr:C39 family peptidase [Alistipes sp.]